MTRGPIPSLIAKYERNEIGDGLLQGGHGLGSGGRRGKGEGGSRRGLIASRKAPGRISPMRPDSTR